VLTVGAEIPAITLREDGEIVTAPADTTGEVIAELEATGEGESVTGPSWTVGAANVAPAETGVGVRVIEFVAAGAAIATVELRAEGARRTAPRTTETAAMTALLRTGEGVAIWDPTEVSAFHSICPIFVELRLLGLPPALVPITLHSTSEPSELESSLTSQVKLITA